VKTLEEETGVTAVVVDAIYAIRHWSFKKGETFSTISGRYQHNLLTDIPAGTKTTHFFCDRYSGPSLKSAEQERRYGRPKPANVGLYEVSELYKAPIHNSSLPTQLTRL